jgi:hypothetical protein
MASYPIEIRRCRHIRTNGAQCGSPALKEKQFCYYHQENQPRAVELYIDGERYSDGNFMLPVFEDAHSIQMALRQVVELMFQRRIDRKDAGLMLYALQIASGNLKTMQAERAKPTHVVVEPEKTGETPLGMTPWSASGQGHDEEEETKEDGEGYDMDEEETEGDEMDFAPVSAEGASENLRPCHRSEVTGDRSQEEHSIDRPTADVPGAGEQPVHEACRTCSNFIRWARR